MAPPASASLHPSSVCILDQEQRETVLLPAQGLTAMANPEDTPAQQPAVADLLAQYLQIGTGCVSCRVSDQIASAVGGEVPRQKWHRPRAQVCIPAAFVYWIRNSEKPFYCQLKDLRLWPTRKTLLHSNRQLRICWPNIFRSEPAA